MKLETKRMRIRANKTWRHDRRVRELWRKRDFPCEAVRKRRKRKKSGQKEFKNYKKITRKPKKMKRKRYKKKSEEDIDKLWRKETSKKEEKRVEEIKMAEKHGSISVNIEKRRQRSSNN